MNKDNWKELRKTGLIAFLLALPIALWRETKIGKRISWLLVIITLFWVAEKGVDFTFNHVINRWEIRESANKALGGIKEAQSRIDSTTANINGLDSIVKQRIEKRVEEEVGKVNQRLESVLGGQAGQRGGSGRGIAEIEASITAFKEGEREAVRTRIIDLRERIKVLKESVDKATNRKEFEEIFKNMSLLGEDEKSRFLHDLKDMGFYLEKEDGNVRLIRGGRTFGISSDAVAYMSFDSSSYRYGDDQ